MGLANRDWTAEEFELLLKTPGTGVHDLYEQRASERGVEVTRTWARDHVWNDAVEKVAADPAHHRGDSPDLDALLKFAEQTAWTGKHGPIVRAVYLALVIIYDRYGSMPFNASQRELAELSGVGSRNTVTQALTTLVREDIISQASGLKASARTDLGVADAWRFERPVHEGLDGRGRVSRFPLEHLGHDLFYSRALGKTAQLVYDQVEAAPGDEAELVLRTGLSRRLINKQVKRLEGADLIGRREDGTLFLTGVDLDEVALKLGIPQRSSAQRNRHDEERSEYLRVWVQRDH
jgi:DNA-binding MarR family transcriptional regulator